MKSKIKYMNPNQNKLLQAYQQRNNMYPQILQARIQEANQLKRMQELKKIEKVQTMNQLKDKKKIQDIVIKPVKIDRNNSDVIQDHQVRKEIYDEFKMKKEKEWKKRTNQPYKAVLKNVLTEEDYKKQFKSKDDLIIHRVSQVDKEGLDDKFDDFLDDIEVHDKELKTIYSVSKEAEHKKKFEYNHVSKYRIKETPSDHKQLKESHIDAFKKEQRRQEKGKKQQEDILNQLLDSGYIQEIKEIEAEEMEENKILEELGVLPEVKNIKQTNNNETDDIDVDKLLSDIMR
jgi:hypothetical protein